MSRFRHPAIRQLSDQQARFAPVDRQLEQLDKAELMAQSLDPPATYKYQDLCEQLTGFRSQQYPDLVISGEDAIHDLRLFAEELSGSVNLPVESAGEPVLTVDEISRRYNISTRTVDRWRKRGLPARRFLIGNRSRVGFLASAVDRFVNAHEQSVARGSQFTKLSGAERDEIIESARQLARYGARTAEISQRLSERFERSPETIRHALRKHDDAHPGDRILSPAVEGLTTTDRELMYEKYRAGAPVDQLAAEFRRTRTSVYRVIAEVRADRLCGARIDFMDSPDFHVANTDRTILAALPGAERKATRVKAPSGLPPYLASLYSIPLLTREEEVYYFRKMNFLKFRAAELQKKICRTRPRTADLNDLEELLDAAVEIKNFLIRSNLRLVVSIAKRRLRPGANFFEMVSDGNMSLIRAIEKFDYTKGNKFSTYATWAIMKNFARSIPAEHTLLDRFRTGHEEVFQGAPDSRGNAFAEETTNARQHEILMTILEQLEERERSILVHRYGLQPGAEPLTLEQVGSRFGVTKERIRQIEARALQKLRRIAHDERLEVPGM